MRSPHHPALKGRGTPAPSLAFGEPSFGMGLVLSFPNWEKHRTCPPIHGFDCIDNSLYFDMLYPFRDPSEPRDEPGLPYLCDSPSRLVPGRSSRDSARFLNRNLDGLEACLVSCCQ